MIDDAHSLVQDALTGGSDSDSGGLHDLRLADLNETEREHALTALAALHELDNALEVRSGFESLDYPARKTGDTDE